MSQNTEDDTSKLLLEKEEISDASLDGVSGGKGLNWKQIGKTASHALGAVSAVLGITAATKDIGAK